VIYADLHIHTTYSSDSSILPKIMVETLVKHSFVKVAAITDHDTIGACRMARQLASAYPDILVIPATEISTPNGDVVILGAEEMPPHPWTVENVVDFARERDYVSIVAHPYREYGMGDLARNYKFDAIEVLNGGSSQSANESARELAKQMGLPGTAGSDAHQPAELCSVYTEIQASMDVDEILRAIKKGSISVSPIGKSIRF
jgi:predicted metal-dependent phosphoesterase TrpH